MKIVCYPALDADRARKFAEAAGRATVVQAASLEAAQAAVVDADGFFGKLTPAILSAAKNLRWVQSPTASLEHYLFPALVEHPCTLTNMRGIFSDVIADHVMSYVLCFARNLHIYLRQQEARLWRPVGDEPGAGQNFVTGPGLATPRDLAHLHLADCTMGVVGFGAIGRETARRAAGFGMRVLAVDPVVADRPEFVDSLGDMGRLGELLAVADFVVVCAPHTPETEGMFDRRLFQAMRNSAFFINIGRGAIVRLDDLAAALEAGELAGAALDVFETEPLPESHPLWQMPNVLITPHVAACSPRIAERHLEVLLDNVRRFAADEPLRNVVDKRKWF
ncbi:MAG: D-2-hydroxyacid dehydrogenase [Planctomycetales bacterium]|nr:D-2-hydroxyacid dehydrogenase [Planctomycetales bacterium]MBN8626359.1 D-2-hydroxyacid dehydrogenase [Planctomycetota bacterium]